MGIGLIPMNLRVGEAGLHDLHEHAQNDQVPMPSGRASTSTDPSLLKRNLDELAKLAGDVAMVTCVSVWRRGAGETGWQLVCSATGSGPACPDQLGGSSEPLRARLNSQLDKAHARRRAVLKRECATPGDPQSELWCFAVPLHEERFDCVLTIEAIGREDRLRALTPMVASARGEIEISLSRYRVPEARVAKGEETLAQWLRVLGSQASETTTARRLLEASVATAQADTASVMLTTPDGDLKIVACHGLPAGVMASTRVGVGEGIAGWVLATGSPVAVDDLVHGEAGRRHGITSAISMPLASQGSVVGVLNVGTRRTGIEWRRDAAEPLDSLGRAAAASIATIRSGKHAGLTQTDLPTTEELLLRRIDVAAD